MNKAKIIAITEAARKLGFLAQSVVVDDRKVFANIAFNILTMGDRLVLELERARETELEIGNDDLAESINPLIESLEAARKRICGLLDQHEISLIDEIERSLTMKAVRSL